MNTQTPLRSQCRWPKNSPKRSKRKFQLREVAWWSDTRETVIAILMRARTLSWSQAWPIFPDAAEGSPSSWAAKKCQCRCWAGPKKIRRRLAARTKGIPLEVADRARISRLARSWAPKPRSLIWWICFCPWKFRIRPLWLRLRRIWACLRRWPRPSSTWAYCLSSLRLANQTRAIFLSRTKWQVTSIITVDVGFLSGCFFAIDKCGIIDTSIMVLAYLGIIDLYPNSSLIFFLKSCLLESLITNCLKGLSDNYLSIWEQQHYAW